MTEEWLTVSEAVATLGVSERTIRRRVKAGQLEAKRQANRLYVRVTPDTPDTEPATPDLRAKLEAQERIIAHLESEVEFLRQAHAAALSGQQLLIEAQTSGESQAQRLTRRPWWQFWKPDEPIEE